MKVFHPLPLLTEKLLPWTMVLCAMLIVPVWPLMPAMALRNLFIFVGGSIGFWYLIRERRSLSCVASMPILLVFLMFGWVVLHYLWLSTSISLEWYQIKGTWLRSLFAFFLAIGTGLFARQNMRAQLAVWIGLILFIVVFFTNYLWLSYSNNNWAIPYPDPYHFGVYGLKLSSIYFGMMLLSFLCAVVLHFLAKKSPWSTRVLAASICGIGLTFFAFVIEDTKNGVALGGILVLALIIIFFARAPRSPRNISLSLALLALVALAGYIHVKHNPAWSDVIQTANIGVQIDRYKNWQDFEANGLPTLDNGRVAHESFYLRTAFATEGLRLLGRHPFGYGSIDTSFGFLVKEDLPDGANIRHRLSHSGWLDLALGFGFPALVFTWGAMGLAAFYSLKQNTLWASATRWVFAGLFLTWLFAEVSNHVYVEALYYFIALFSAGNIPVGANIPRGKS